MNVFLINSLLYFQGRYLDICRSAERARRKRHAMIANRRPSRSS